MKLIWHSIKYNILFNYVRIIFLTITSFLIWLSGVLIYTKNDELGTHLVQFSFYIIFFLVLSRINNLNNLMFSIKHRAALPMTNSQIVFHQSIADIVFFVPVAITFSLGVYYLVETIPYIVILFGVLAAFVVINIIALNKRIDFSRMVHSKTSFKNSIILLDKYLTSVVGLFLLFLIGLFGYNALKESPVYLAWGYFVAISIGVFVTYTSALKMLSDETRSYFIFKRDSIRILGKLAVVAIPYYIASTLMSKEMLNSHNAKFVKKIFDEITIKMSLSDEETQSPYVMSLWKKDFKKFEKAMQNEKNIPWDYTQNGGYLIHLAVATKDPRFVNLILDTKPEVVNQKGSILKSLPLHTAVSECDLKMMDLLIERGSKLNTKTKKGQTPLMAAAYRGCYGGMFTLIEHGADPSVQTKEGKTYLDFISSKSGLKEYLSKQKPQMHRLPATTTKNSL